MKELVFLGAGAAVDAGLPTNRDFGTRVVKALYVNRPYLEISVTKALGDTPRNPQKLLGLIASFDNEVPGYDTEKTSLKSAFNANYYDFQLRDMLGDAILRTLQIPQDAWHLGYLSPLVKTAAARSMEDFCIVTTNYDTAIESCAKLNNLWCDVLAMDTLERLVNIQYQIKLLKLRGSVDWLLSEYADYVVKIPKHEWGRLGRSKRCMLAENNKPGLIYEVLRSQRDEFQQRLDNADLLTIIGCSLEDTQQANQFQQWLNASNSRKIRMINPQPGKHVLAFNASVPPQQLSFLQMTAKQGIPEFYAE